MKYLKDWTQGLSEEDSREVVQKLKQAEFVLTKLSDILDQRVRSSVNGQRSQSNYDSPSWALLQADKIGYQRALTEVIELIRERV